MIRSSLLQFSALVLSNLPSRTPRQSPRPASCSPSRKPHPETLRREGNRTGCQRQDCREYHCINHEDLRRVLDWVAKPCRLSRRLDCSHEGHVPVMCGDIPPELGGG